MVDPRDGTARRRLQRFGTTRRTQPSRLRRDSLRRSGRESCRHNIRPRRTTRLSLRISRYPSPFRLLDCKLNGPHLVVLSIITQRPRYCHWFGDLRVNEVSMATLAASIYKPGSLKISDQFSDLRRHVYALLTVV